MRWLTIFVFVEELAVRGGVALVTQCTVVLVEITAGVGINFVVIIHSTCEIKHIQYRYNNQNRSG